VVENLIIGSGFVSWALSRRLLALNRAFCVLDVSCLKDALEVSSSCEFFVDPVAVNKTARVGGGAKVWGGAFSWPDSGNWFATEDRAWLSVQEGFGRPGTPSYQRLRSWGLRARTKQLAKSSKNPTLPFLNLEGHLVPRNWKWFSHRVHGSKTKILETATSLIEVKSRPEGGGVIEYLDKSVRKTINAERVYLASGPVINAVLAHLMSGQSKFPMGNHLSRVVGKLTIKSPRRLGPFARLKSTGKFVTYSSPEASATSTGESKGGLHHSLRLVPDETCGSLRELRISPSVSSITRFILLRLGMPQSLSVLQMVDSGLVENALLVESEKMENGCLRVKIDFQMSVSDECFRSADRLVGEFVSNLKPWASFGPILNPDLRDAAHYWGSLPMMKSAPGRKQSVVNEEFEICDLKGVFAPGASSFPLGSHGHPTFLAILTALQIR